MKGFKKDGKFRPTGKRNKSSLTSADIRKVTDNCTTCQDLKFKEELANNDRLDISLYHRAGQNYDKHLETHKELFNRKKDSLDSSESDMIHYILQNTDDGDELSGQHLGLVEAGANHNLTDEGKKALKELHDQVKSGQYELPAFHGIKNMTKDQEGYVYWKGKQIEHYSFDDYQDEEFSAKELEANILNLQAKGVEITGANILDNYDNLRENQSQWKRTNYLVSAMKNGRPTGNWEESDWTHGRDKQHAKEEFVRKHPDVRFDELEVLTNDEWNEKYPRR
jgi:hypothetical protein